MSANEITPIRIQRAGEQLRQERETFDLRKVQEARWFVLRLIMGYVAVLLMLVVVAMVGLVLYNEEKFSDFVVNAASVALFVDVVGMLIAIWKIVLNPNFMTKLTAETLEEL